LFIGSEQPDNLEAQSEIEEARVLAYRQDQLGPGNRVFVIKPPEYRSWSINVLESQDYTCATTLWIFIMACI
jgi:hypothetical protein